jgi:hypothetical protein
MQFTEEMVSRGGALVLAEGPVMKDIATQEGDGFMSENHDRIEFPWNSEATLAMSRLSVLCARDPDEEEEEEEDLDYFSDDEEDDDDLDDEDDLDDDFEEEDDDEDEADDDDF